MQEAAAVPEMPPSREPLSTTKTLSNGPPSNLAHPDVPTVNTNKATKSRHHESAAAFAAHKTASCKR